QALQRRAFQRTTGEAAIVVLITYRHPALGPLAGDIGSAGLSLGVERVELHVEALLAGFARIDRTAHPARHGDDGATVCARHWLCLGASRRPKKRYPFQRVPVMSR